MICIDLMDVGIHLPVGTRCAVAHSAVQPKRQQLWIHRLLPAVIMQPQATTTFVTLNGRTTYAHTRSTLYQWSIIVLSSNYVYSSASRIHSTQPNKSRPVSHGQMSELGCSQNSRGVSWLQVVTSESYCEAVLSMGHCLIPLTCRCYTLYLYLISLTVFCRFPVHDDTLSDHSTSPFNSVPPICRTLSRFSIIDLQSPK
jgi:hypothetical protein